MAAEFLERGLVTVFGKAHEITKPSRTVGRGSGKTSAVQDVSNTIEVSGIPETTSEEFLRMYFENKKRSGGGDIKTMTYDKQEGVATITFSDSSGSNSPNSLELVYVHELSILFSSIYEIADAT